MDFLNLTINMQSPQQSTALIGAAIIGALITGAASLVIAIYNELKGAKNKKIQV